LGAPRISYASPPSSGGLALKLAVQILEGQEVERTTILPLPIVTSDTVKLCETGSWEEMRDGCNAFPPAFVPNPGWFASIFSEATPELGMQAALVGQPERD
jgi:ribose transport system substrate-binding protein